MKKIKDIIILLILGLTNMYLSFVIPTSLGISNIIIARTLTVTTGDITYETLIFFALAFIEIGIYEFYEKIIIKKI